MKKTMVALGLLLIGALTFGVISSSAIDPLASDLSRIKSNTDRNEKVEKKVLVQVGPKEITNTDVLNYKELNSISQSVSNVTDSDILKHMIKEELFLQLAEQEGVSATLEEGRQEANKMRDLLSEQPKEVQDTHKMLIEASGVTEEEHWEKIAPGQYQKILSSQNLAEKIWNEHASAQKEPADPATVLQEFKDQLLQSSISNGTVKFIDKSISL
ncbi:MULTISPECIES: hypothetical protein [Paenibacillus]|uniref:Peptidylprolyl isomerase n=1 Tax=Paenibacillus campinasensis TaxID=66347 RepID=A0ABW9T197_9BACL|nr:MULTISPECIES: hypothetical protein [Paenibacillus]MUG67059.1 hypothetical protein [Paenibacillus campinasensis]PAK50749.1 hypothetical protein CHH75_16065 [Paenibacillus sp. 7541]